MPEPVVVTARELGKRFQIWTHSRPTSLSDRFEHLAGAIRHPRRSDQPDRPRRQAIWALEDVAFDVRRGEVLGIIGPNGAGKSTLLSILARITEPTTGRVEIHGRVSSLLEVGTGFHPELSGRDNIFLNGAILGMSRREVEEKYDEIVEFSGVRDFIDMPVKRYSSGMYVRLGFSVAAHLDPEILLLDEVLAVGDRSFQEKCLARIAEIVHSGRAVIFVSHDVASVARLCHRGLVLNSGRVAFDGAVDQAVAAYLSSTPLGVDEGAKIDREGTGELRIERITVTSANGAGVVKADRPAEIRVDLLGAWPRHGEPIRLQLGIHSTYGGMHVLLSTDYDPSSPLDTAELGEGSAVVCRVDELPLKPGRYTVSATLQRAGGEIVDRVSDKGLFAIIPSDYFGTGVLAGENNAATTLVRHRWDVLSRAEADLGIEVGEAIG
ncbi:MAG: ABC transporter ATP-binding protein [Gaiellaceae bacterium]